MINRKQCNEGYNYNGDLNQDGQNDVLDIVQLVNDILNG